MSILRNTSVSNSNASNSGAPSARGSTWAMVQIALVALLTAGAVLAQTVGGTITGTVRDPQGSLIATTAVKLVNVETGVMNDQLTNNAGIYRAANLQPGHYDITVTNPGFATGVVKNVNLNVGSEVVVDFTLTVAGVAS